MPPQRDVPKRPSPFDSNGEVVDDYSIRCPHCGDVTTAFDQENPRFYEDGCHDVSCDECGADFEVSTSVMIMFTSPALKTKDSE